MGEEEHLATTKMQAYKKHNQATRECGGLEGSEGRAEVQAVVMCSGVLAGA